MKILVLTSVYPQPEDDKKAGVTPVVHYFAKEWVKSGNDVLVIHNSNKFIFLLYLLPDFIKRKINSFMGMAIPKLSQSKGLYRVSDGVKIKRIPILKIFPRLDFSHVQVLSQYKKIRRTLSKANFTPDLIIGHWEAPQIQLVSMLKDQYNCKSAIVFHEVGYISRKSYFNRNRKYIENIDVIGGRSKPISKRLKSLLQLPYEPFICYSGIPDDYIEKNTTKELKKNFEDGNLIEFLYVGRLIKRKYIDSIIMALNNVYGDKNFILNVIGTGECEQELKNLTNNLSINDRVYFKGLIPRENVIDYMRKTQCFTMISKNEAFGLVYLEAMAQGCIVIASKNEGFDGIIVDGENGFLCEAGNDKELAEIYARINSLSRHEKEAISRNAIMTALSFKDSDVAKKYLDNIMLTT